jgi:hypothetical protein
VAPKAATKFLPPDSAEEIKGVGWRVPKGQMIGGRSTSYELYDYDGKRLT